MKIVIPDRDSLPDFIAYCRRHRHEVDETFLHDEDLEGFAADRENPTVLAVDGRDRPVGAGSLVVNGHMRRGNRARVRILHAEGGCQPAYEGMLRALLPGLAGLGQLYAYAPDRNTAQAEAFLRLGFHVDRYSYIMAREGRPAQGTGLPEGFSVEPCRQRRDEQAWCDVRNAAFATLRGNETPITADMAAKQLFGEDTLEGGALMLLSGRKPVGVVRVGRDESADGPAAEIGPLAILPDWQGRGLGRCLLRAALRLAADRGYEKTVLCVNAENEKATELYKGEGFRRTETAVCFRYDLALPE